MKVIEMVVPAKGGYRVGAFKHRLEKAAILPRGIHFPVSHDPSGFSALSQQSIFRQRNMEECIEGNLL